MHLFDLLIELLAFIVSFLEHEYDLNAFSQANKRLYQLFNRAVYTLSANDKFSSNPALEWAADHGNEATSRRALEAGSSPYPKYNEGGYSPMALAAMDGNEDLVRLFLEKVDPNDESYWERTKEPVSLAAEKGYKSIVRILLDLELPSTNTTLTQKLPIHRWK
ncbi:uncharacterized protein ASPGLDRAFT_27460 [Aspergillus glaucus CBS 516.65]|uniref:Uncharacterized protein n=1 Tax=Aspergillus glaucus CBS 516.65 TaxID=1160497 RepID=A0A1L9VDS4_ASPGL|nr:hypothetical protein ASPGLDRAFT_27460 [Aspergillus glaucus CBS 516.65]OJJ82050.1 hypothetical protein ASPGLDRAFT_27460 [Aspergillus glaucus CBS 516.65]